MEAVIKVGGSIAKEVTSLRDLCLELDRLAKYHRIVVMPGGGKFADTVREHDDAYRLSGKVSHKMAILAMDQYGLMLSSIVSNSRCIYDLRETSDHLDSGFLPIFLPSRFLSLKGGGLEPSWDVTSDSIAAYVCRCMNVSMLILVKNVDGIFLDDPKETTNTLLEEVSASELLSWERGTCVDRYLPKILLESEIVCYVVNGSHPERIGRILKGETTICTRIT